MATPLHINTTVKGSVAQCREAASALRKSHESAENAVDRFRSARDHTDHEGWDGPASEAFLDHHRPQLDLTKDLAKTCHVYGEALYEFAGMLDSVYTDMETVLAKARAGDLTVQGPFVMRPEHPGSAPRVPTDLVRQGSASERYDAYRQEREGYLAKVIEYNAKVAVFNECLAIFKRARDKEEEAHTDLWEQLRAGKGFDLADGWIIGTTTASAMIAAIENGEGHRGRLLARINMRQPLAGVLMELAMGGLPRNWEQLRRNKYLRTALSVEGDRRARVHQLKELDQMMSRIPPGIRRGVVAHRGMSLDDGAVKAVLKKAPYVGGILVAGNQAVGAMNGEQTWGEAVAKTVGELGGGAAGAAGGAAVCSPLAPPVGPIVCGTAGAVAGGFIGGEVAGWFVPDETMPDRARPVMVYDPPYGGGW